MITGLESQDSVSPNNDVLWLFCLSIAGVARSCSEEQLPVLLPNFSKEHDFSVQEMNLAHCSLVCNCHEEGVPHCSLCRMQFQVRLPTLGF